MFDIYESGFNFTSASLQNVDTYQRIAETFKFGYALRTYLGDELFANVSEVSELRTCSVLQGVAFK